MLQYNFFFNFRKNISHKPPQQEIYFSSLVLTREIRQHTLSTTSVATALLQSDTLLIRFAQSFARSTS